MRADFYSANMDVELAAHCLGMELLLRATGVVVDYFDPGMRLSQLLLYTLKAKRLLQMEGQRLAMCPQYWDTHASAVNGDVLIEYFCGFDACFAFFFALAMLSCRVNPWAKIVG